MTSFTQENTSKVAAGIKELFNNFDNYQAHIERLKETSSAILGQIIARTGETKFNLPDGRVVVICEKRGGDRGWFLRVLNQKGKGVEVK